MPTRISGNAEAQERTVTATAKIAVALARTGRAAEEGGRHGRAYRPVAPLDKAAN